MCASTKLALIDHRQLQYKYFTLYYTTITGSLDRLVHNILILATGKIHTAQWIISNDLGGTLVSKKDKNGDTPAHDAAESG